MVDAAWLAQSAVLAPHPSSEWQLGMVWYGMVQCGMVDAAWLAQSAVLAPSSGWRLGMVWHGMVWYG